jgi:hypothetical protein
MINRRDWLQGICGGLLGATAGAQARTASEKPRSKPLDLSECEPRSMLHVNETPVERAKYAAIVDRKNIQALTNLTGGWGQGLEETIAKYDRAYPGRFYTFTTPCCSRFKEPDYPKIQAIAIEAAHRGRCSRAQDP